MLDEVKSKNSGDPTQAGNWMRDSIVGTYNEGMWSQKRRFVKLRRVNCANVDRETGRTTPRQKNREKKNRCRFGETTKGSKCGKSDIVLGHAQGGGEEHGGTSVAKGSWTWGQNKKRDDNGGTECCDLWG